MSVKKGINNFLKYQQGIKKKRLELIRNTLAIFAKRKKSFNSLLSLINEVELVTKIHRTRLMRTKEYQSILIEYLINQRGSTSFLAAKDATPDILRSRLEAKDVEINKLRRDLKRLEIRLSKENTVQTQEPVRTQDVGAKDSPDEDVTVLLMMVLQRFADSIQVDRSNHQIIDLSERGSKRIIAKPPRTTSFFKWLEGLNVFDKAKLTK